MTSCTDLDGTGCAHPCASLCDAEEAQAMRRRADDAKRQREEPQCEEPHLKRHSAKRHLVGAVGPGRNRRNRGGRTPLLLRPPHAPPVSVQRAA
eukprot:2099014-Rhodomonas_salina.1